MRTAPQWLERAPIDRDVALQQQHMGMFHAEAIGRPWPHKDIIAAVPASFIINLNAKNGI